MSGRDPVVDEILAVLPLDDYGHVIECGYDDNDERCGCYDLPSKLQAIVARHVAAALAPVRTFADDGYWLVKFYGDHCGTCHTQWQAAAVNPGPLLDDAERDAS